MPDFGQALAILGARDEALGQVWHVPSPAAVTQAEVLALLAAEIGRPVKPLMGTALLLRALGLFNPMIRETVEMLYEWTQPFVLDSSTFERTFAMPPTPLRQMVQETVTWARQNELSLAAAH